MLALVLLALCAALPAAAQPPETPPAETLTPEARPAVAEVFRDVTARSGIDFEHPHSPEVKYIVEAANGGVALFDYDRDGFQDLYVTGLEHNHLFRNRGGKSFADVTAEAGASGGGWSTGCAFADFDRDGDLDLFVSRYVTVSLAKLPDFGKGQFCMYREMPVHCGPRGLPGISDLFFSNDGAGRFTEVGRKIGAGDPDELYGLGAVWLDADADGWLDLFVANDTTANFLYMNQRDGTFEDMGLLMGVAVNEDGKPQGSMGIAVGDYLNEGRLSLFVTNFAEEYNALYRNAGGYFTDVSFRSGVALSSLRYVGWGTAFLDFDNDGWLDLLLVNGHVYPQVSGLELDAIAPYRQRRLLYRNRRDGTFEEITSETGGPLLAERVSRGTAVGDLDNDGRLDVVVNNLAGKAEVWLGAHPDAGNWLSVKLAGAGKMTDAIGATVHLKAGGQNQMRLIQSGSNYLSQDDMRAHFGLGEAERAEEIEVRWPDGTAPKRRDVAANQQIVIEQSREPVTGQR